jgi:hypothetical protein
VGVFKLCINIKGSNQIIVIYQKSRILINLPSANPPSRAAKYFSLSQSKKGKLEEIQKYKERKNA